MREYDEKAWRDALRDMAKEDRLTIPHPSAVAAHLPLYLVKALLEAKLGPEGYRVARHRDELFSRGLVGARTCYLTAYGHAVRRTLKEDE